VDDQPVVSVGDVSIARLHGHACWDCGAVHAALSPAGLRQGPRTRGTLADRPLLGRLCLRPWGPGVTRRCDRTPLPESVSALSHDQYLGRACVACGRQLTTGAVPRGVIPGRQGAHVLDVEVWSCPAPGAAR
jgi:hypothetical protein